MRPVRIGLGLWAGLLVWLMVVVGSLFAQVADRALAGALAGSLFRQATWLSVGFAAALIALTRAPWPARLLPLAPALLLLVNELWLRPAMRAAALAHSGFALWHGLASAIYLVATALVISLWWRAEGAAVRRAE
jgi:hypothetical protein